MIKSGTLGNLRIYSESREFVDLYPESEQSRQKKLQKTQCPGWHMINFLGTLFNFFNCPLKQSIQWVTVTITWKLRRLNNEYTQKAKYTAWKIKFLKHVWPFLFISQRIDRWLLGRCQKCLAFDRFVFQYKNMA